jgi:alpha-ketoglutarate-dependent taurine dioxygenase
LNVTGLDAQPVSGIDTSHADQIVVPQKSTTIGAVLRSVEMSSTLSDPAIGRRFGELAVHPFAPEKPGFPEVLDITHDENSAGYENLWHSDVTWRADPSFGSILRLLEGPDAGGDTLFADMYAAYDGLLQRIKDRVDGQVARHDFVGFRRGLRKRGATDEEIAEFDATYPNPEHPVIRTHSRTGRKAIYVKAAFTQEIVGRAPTTISGQTDKRRDGPCTSRSNTMTKISNASPRASSHAPQPPSKLLVAQPGMDSSEASADVVDSFKSFLPMGFWAVTRFDGLVQLDVEVRDNSYGLGPVDSTCGRSRSTSNWLPR